jgi:hypothetical protein
LLAILADTGRSSRREVNLDVDHFVAAERAVQVCAW